MPHTDADSTVPGEPEYTVATDGACQRNPGPAGWDLPYRRIQRGDYWVEDNRSPFYNRYRT